MVFKALNNQALTYLIDMFKPPCTNTHHGLSPKTSNKLQYQMRTAKVSDIMGQKFGILSMITPVKQNSLIDLKVNIRHFKILRKTKRVINIFKIPNSMYF